MLDWADGNWLRVAAYVVAGVAALAVGVRESQRERANSNLWPKFWFLTAAVLLVMSIGRTGDLGQWVSELGRRVAVSEGWYAGRRKPQAIAVGTVGAIWLVVVIVMLWRVPERRRRYLPTALMVFTLLCYAGIRLVSLHQVDSLLYRRDIAGMHIDAALELALLAAATAIICWPPKPAAPRVPAPAALAERGGRSD